MTKIPSRDKSLVYRQISKITQSAFGCLQYQSLCSKAFPKFCHTCIYCYDFNFWYLKTAKKDMCIVSMWPYKMDNCDIFYEERSEHLYLDYILRFHPCYPSACDYLKNWTKCRSVTWQSAESTSSAWLILCDAFVFRKSSSVCSLSTCTRYLHVYFLVRT